MTTLSDKINIAHENKKLLYSKRDAILLNIETYNLEIAQAQKTGFEILIELFTLGFVTFSSKYAAIIEVFQKKITAEKQEIEKIDNELNKLEINITAFEKEFLTKLDEFKEQLLKFQSKLELLSQMQYINNYTQMEFLEELNKLIINKDKFLSHDKIINFIKNLLEFKKDPQKWTNNSNQLFIKNEKIKEKHFFDTVESQPLTDKQIEAVLTNENNNLVLAGAGSGKTSVVVAKVLYMIKKNLLQPSQILILAFNKNAQEELSERFAKKDIHVEIKTFHSFGLSIISEASSQKYDICRMSESPQNMSKFIRDTIRELAKTVDAFFELFLNFVAYFNIPYKDEKEFESLGEYYEYLKNYDMKTLAHDVEKRNQENTETLTTLQQETVKSYQELVIANFLTLNGIKYLYEEPYQHRTYTTQKRQYKPDFYLPEHDVYIEHFGIDRNDKTASFVDNEKYLEDMDWKRTLHKEKNTKLVETYSYEYTEQKLLSHLKKKLLKHGVVFRKLDKSELFQLINSPIEKDEFTKLFTTFLNHFKSNMHNLDDLKTKAKDLERTGIFLKLFEFIFNEYKKFQVKNNCIDFDDMIVKALEIIEDGKYRHQFKHIFIDEFQDISTTRARLITQLLPINNTSTTAVGDDWQSINKFAGSNIKIIQQFQEYFGVSQTVALDYTFRFNNIVSNIASTFIQKNPYQIKKVIKTIKKQTDTKASLLVYWTTENTRTDLEQILNLIVKKEKDKKIKIMVLARYKFLFDTIEESQYERLYPTFDIVFSTVHSSKGNEADYIIILNINNGKFGFPSKIEDDPILDIVVPFGDDFEDAEERRLFYVALTRTKGAIFLLSYIYNKSIFVDELIQDCKNEIFFLNNPEIQPINCPECKTGYLKKRAESKDKNKHYYSCSNSPRCKYTEKMHYCPDCDSEIIKNIENKIAKCINPKCDFETALCMKCNGYMIQRSGLFGAFFGCTNYPRCDYKAALKTQLKGK